MKRRARQFLGTIAMLAYLAFFTLAMTVLAYALAAHTDSAVARYAFYALAGFGWLPGAMFIIRWMAGPRGG